jgi:quinol monooxygenase YgiN
MQGEAVIVAQGRPVACLPLSLRAAAAGVTSALAPGVKAIKEHVRMSTPKPGQVVVTYIDRFKADSFAAGADLAVQGFTAAYKAHGAPVHLYYATNEDEHELIGIVFYESEAAFDAWQASPHRKRVVDQIKPLLREALMMRRYTVVSAHEVGSAR